MPDLLLGASAGAGHLVMGLVVTNWGASALDLGHTDYAHQLWNAAA